MSDDDLLAAMRARLKQRYITAEFQRHHCRNGTSVTYVRGANWQRRAYLGRLDVLAEMSEDDFDALIASKYGNDIKVEQK